MARCRQRRQRSTSGRAGAFGPGLSGRAWVPRRNESRKRKTRSWGGALGSGSAEKLLGQKAGPPNLMACPLSLPIQRPFLIVFESATPRGILEVFVDHSYRPATRVQKSTTESRGVPQGQATESRALGTIHPALLAPRGASTSLHTGC